MLSDSVKVCETAEQGRYLVATRDIAVGEQVGSTSYEHRHFAFWYLFRWQRSLPPLLCYFHLWVKATVPPASSNCLLIPASYLALNVLLSSVGQRAGTRPAMLSSVGWSTLWMRFWNRSSCLFSLYSHIPSPLLPYLFSYWRARPPDSWISLSILPPCIGPSEQSTTLRIVKVWRMNVKTKRNMVKLW